MVPAEKRVLGSYKAEQKEMYSNIKHLRGAPAHESEIADMWGLNSFLTAMYLSILGLLLLLWMMETFYFHSL